MSAMKTDAELLAEAVGWLGALDKRLSYAMCGGIEKDGCWPEWRGAQAFLAAYEALERKPCPTCDGRRLVDGGDDVLGGTAYVPCPTCCPEKP